MIAFACKALCLHDYCNIVLNGCAVSIPYMTHVRVKQTELRIFTICPGFPYSLPTPCPGVDIQSACPLLPSVRALTMNIFATRDGTMRLVMK